MCTAPSGALTIPKLVTDESIAGTTTSSTIACPPRAYLLPPSVRPRQRWGVTCSLASPAEKVAMTGLALGTTTMKVGGHPVTVEHTRFSLTFGGNDRGTNPTDFWIVPGNGLIVRERETVSMTQGSVRYDETMEATLTSLSPAR